MTNIWIIYDELRRATGILGTLTDYTPREKVDKGIDDAWDILYRNVPKLEEAITQLEEQNAH